MKKNWFCIFAAFTLICACKKTTTDLPSDFSSCYISTYYYTYSGGGTDTTEVTYISPDSLSYTTRSYSGTKYIYCYKIGHDSVSVRRYTNDLSVLSFYGNSKVNSQGLSIQDLFYKQNGTINSTGTSTYNSDARPIHQFSDYVDYQNDYVNYYDAKGNKAYTIYTLTGITNYRDSMAYTYDLSKLSILAYGYPNAGFYGRADNNLVTQVRRYVTGPDTLRLTTDYTYSVDSDGFVTQRNTTTTYAGSGIVYNYVEKFTHTCN
jgi:hypothetical protein